MKVLKGIFFSIIFLIMAGCTGILVCAFNPSLTAKLADMVPGQSGGIGGSWGGAEEPSVGNGGTIGGGDSQNVIGGISPWQQGISEGSPDDARLADARPGINTGWMDGRDEVSYEIPGDQPERIPDSVSGRNGYESVKEDAEQIAQEEADDLSKTIAFGETGSDLRFNETYYPYYAMLQEDMQRLYNQIYANALKLTESFAPVTPVSVGQLKSVFEAVYNDHPELFWLESGYSCKYLRSGMCVEIILKYNDTANHLEEARRNFVAAAEKILSGTGDLGSEYEKEKYVHDALMQEVEYDMGASLNQSAYSALVQGRSVCAGYARAFQYLMQQMDVPCYYCTGFAGEDHAWNIVKSGGNFYNVDVTWDDTNPSTHDYFNKTDREFTATHRRVGLSVYLPACVSGAGNVSISDISDLINPNPVEPPSWQSKTDLGNDGGDAGQDADGNIDVEMAAEEERQANLAKAGITEEQVRDTMEEYYEDCLKLLKEAGVGDKQFSNVIPESLWGAVEQAYNGGAYWEGYAEDALKALGVENFVIQLQAQRLGGGYYRLYHNVYTY